MRTATATDAQDDPADQPEQQPQPDSPRQRTRSSARAVSRTAAHATRPGGVGRHGYSAASTAAGGVRTARAAGTAAASSAPASSTGPDREQQCHRDGDVAADPGRRRDLPPHDPATPEPDGHADDHGGQHRGHRRHRQRRPHLPGVAPSTVSTARSRPWRRPVASSTCTTAAPADRGQHDASTSGQHQQVAEVADLRRGRGAVHLQPRGQLAEQELGAVRRRRAGRR